MMAAFKNLGGRPRHSAAPPSFDQAVGGRIKQRRILCNITPVQLSDRTGLSVHQIGRFESGDQPAKSEQLARIADALGCKASDLLDGIRVTK